MKLLTVDQYLKLISDNDIKQICEPLFKNFGLNYFAYHRIYSDGTRSFIITHNSYAEWIYKNNCSIASSMQSSRITEGMFFMRDHLRFMSKKDIERDMLQAQGAKEYFDLDMGEGCCEIVKRSEPNLCEIYDYSTSPSKSFFNEFYINNQDIINHFILYFKEKAKDIIELADNNRLAAPAYAKRQIEQQKKALSLDLTKAKEIFFNETSLQRLAIEGEYGEVYLTRREIECLLYLIRGRSAKETANILNISPKSVESYIKQVKEKLSCYKRSQLIDKAIDMNLITISSLNWLIPKK